MADRPYITVRTKLEGAVVWGTVKDHSGAIDVKSTEGEGTSVSLYFPISREPYPSHGEVKDTEVPVGKGESILVVDDVPEQREIAIGILNSLGYKATAVSSGEQAVETLRTRSVDLVILDMIMDPGMDGLETYIQILKIHPDQKALIASGFSETEKVREARDLGAGGYIKKPYDVDQIGRAVRSELDRDANRPP